MTGQDTTRMPVSELAAVFVGGGLGTIARALVGDALPHHGSQWPWATFLVNIAGAFLLGYVVTHVKERPPRSAHWRPFLGTGLCGGLTTFSTMQLELLRLLDEDALGVAAAYASASLVLGLTAVALATTMVRRRASVVS
jgi:fluoride exporter